MPESKIRQGPGIFEAIQKVLEEGGNAALITIVEAADKVGAKMLVRDSGTSSGSLGDELLDTAVGRLATAFLESRDAAQVFQVKEFAPELSHWSEARILFERIHPQPEIVICGAGHVGATLARLAAAVNYQVTLIDDRSEFLSVDRISEKEIKLVMADSWADAVRAAIGIGRGVSVAVVTRGHNEDEECLRAVVDTMPDYVGLIGSKRRTNIVLERLRATGVAEEKLQRVHAPVGLDIGAVTPEEVALAILAEIVAERRGGKGGSLSAWRRKRVSSTEG